MVIFSISIVDSLQGMTIDLITMMCKLKRLITEFKEEEA